MAARRDDADIDRLYQLPLEEFTAARNALAKQAAGGGAAIRQLTKPPLAAWAVNQLYWQDRGTYDALIEASEELRRTHKAVLGGRAADLRAAGRAHDEALDRAVKATMAIVTGTGHPASDATRQAVISTLRALPADEPAGRLTRTLQPGGFEMLAGFPIARGSRIAAAPRPAPPSEQKKPARARAKGGSAKDVKAMARAKDAAKAAAQALQRAEHEARREEFEHARAVREAEKAAAAVERARKAVEDAQRELDDAEREAQTADARREKAQRRAAEADAKVSAARKAADAADSELAKLDA